jgi:hypothetical protein
MEKHNEIQEKRKRRGERRIGRGRRKRGGKGSYYQD